jgi:rod shape determining protein RodA
VVRPFLLLFFADYLSTRTLHLSNLIKAFGLLLLPVFLIFIQPSLGVALITLVGFLGILLATQLNKKYFLTGALIFLLTLPLMWSLLAPYQKNRLQSFIDPYADPQGAGYNSIQSMISVGSGKIFGRGLGEGVQTQLEFLPERHTDFIFASTAEELGFLGAFFLLVGLFIVLWRLTKIIENSKSPAARAYVSGLFLVLFAETLIHIGMNIGLLPITGVPLPLVSAGGSSFLASMTGLAIAVNARKQP